MQNGHTNGNRSLGGMVDLAAGTVSREIFVNEEIYAQEQEHLFRAGLGSSWAIYPRFPSPATTSCRAWARNP